MVPFIAALLVSGAQLFMVADARAQEVVPEEDVRRATVYLPGDDEPTEIVYVVVDGLAVYQGDIVLGPASLIEDVSSDANAPSQNGGDDGSVSDVPIVGNRPREPIDLWADGVPYINVGVDEIRLQKAMRQIQESTGIRFTRHSGESDYLRFEPQVDGTYCGLSFIGRQGGEQIVTISNSCDLGTFVHEIGHALGLEHEHTRPDRPVELLEENIAFDLQFLATDPNTTPIGPYDYGSIMHYRNDFAAGPWFASPFGLKPVWRGECNAPERCLSDSDIESLEVLYGRDYPVNDARLLVSDDRDRGGASELVQLDVDGETLYVFVEAATNGIQRVDFRLDGELVRQERIVPFDLGGTDNADGGAFPFDTGELVAGSYQLEARVTFDNGRTLPLYARFDVTSPDTETRSGFSSDDTGSTEMTPGFPLSPSMEAGAPGS